MWWPAVVKSEWELANLRTHMVTGRSQVWVGTGQFLLRLDYGRSPHAYINQRLQIQLELLMMSGVPLETCWTFNERWNNKFDYKVVSWWLFLLSHTAMHGSMNIKSDKCVYFRVRHLLYNSKEYIWCSKDVNVSPLGSWRRVWTLNLLKTKRRMLYLKTQSLPHSKHFSSRL